MIDILLLTDLHGQYGNLDSFLNIDADMIFIAGDLTNFGPVEPVKEILSQIDVPCFVIPGNCDPKELISVLESSNGVSLHGVSMEIGRITITGAGGSNPTPFDTPFELTEEEIDRIIEHATENTKPNIHNILLTHAPPKGYLDLAGGEHVGSESVRKHLKKFDLICCGHIHEQKGIKEVDGVTIVNPGPASEGKCALIRLGDEPKEIEIKFLTV